MSFLAKSLALAPFLLFALEAQPPLCLNAGGPDILDSDGVAIKCRSDAAYVSGGTAYSDPLMGLDELGTLRYGNFSYSVPSTPGFYSLTFDFVEPTKSAPGQRSFSVSVNSIPSNSLDIYSLAGGVGGLYAHYTLKLFAVSNGLINIQFKTILWNAIVSKVVIDKILPQDIFNPYVTLLSFPFASVTKVSATTSNFFPIPADKLVCFITRNGLNQSQLTDYTLSAAVNQTRLLSFVNPPAIGDTVQLLCF